MIEKHVKVSSAAAQHLLKNLAHSPDAIAFVLYLKPDGCSGYQFELKPVVKIDAGMIKIIDILYVAEKFYPAISGLNIDIEKQSNFGFKLVYKLPQASDYCGCGKSFKIDIQEQQEG